MKIAISFFQQIK